jgi:HD superfamily phosphohydrolase YqeK
MMKSDFEYIKRALAIVEIENLHVYVDALLNYWEENPVSSLGHGFGHVLEVAVEAYELAKLNQYDDPKLLFLAGLYHDVYRPAEGKDGEEDHHNKGFSEVEKILSTIEVDELFFKEFKIATSDKWKTSAEPPLFPSILFIADKIALNSRMADAYAWASNDYALMNIKDLPYQTPYQTLNGYVKYMSKIIELVLKLDLIGKEPAISNYVEVLNHCLRMCFNDPEGKNYQNYLDTVADMYREKEMKYLQAFGRSKESIKKIIHEKN